MRLLVTGICLFFFVTLTESSVKTWKTTSDSYSTNWLNNVLPSCPSDRLHFPKTGVVLLPIFGDIEFKEIILPSMGELILTDKVHVSSSSNESSCRGKNVYYNASVPNSWFDPSSWVMEKFEDDEIYGWDPSKNNLAIPHGQRIPCEKDVVKFPRDSIFQINFESEPVTISKWLIGEKSLSVAEITNSVSSLDAKFRFLDLPAESPIALKPLKECHGRDCFCSPDEIQKRLPLVCSTPGASCDSQIKHCSNAVHPTGHCCPICGALMRLEVPRDKFLLSIFEKLIVKQLSLSQDGNIVQAYAGVTGLNNSFIHLQAVLTDHEDASRSIDLAKEIESILKDDMENGNIYSIYNLKVHYSGIAYIGYSGKTFLLLFLLVALLFLFMYGAVMIFIKTTRAPRSEAFTFARFENNPENEGHVDMTVESHPRLSLSKSTLSISTESSVVTKSPSLPTLDERPSLEYIRKQWRRLSTFSQNFINPLFGNAAAEDFLSPVNLSALTKDSRTEDNPFYETAQEQGLTDEDVSISSEIKCLSNPLDISTGDKDTSSDAKMVKTLDTGLVHSMLAPIAEEQLEDISLEGSSGSASEVPKRGAPEEKPPGNNRCRGKNGKGLFKQILQGGRREDGMNLVEKDEKDE